MIRLNDSDSDLDSKAVWINLARFAFEWSPRVAVLAKWRQSQF